MAYIGAEPLPGQNREVDDISSGFNGNATQFTLQVNGLNVSPETANNILVNLGGVIQNPGTDYTIAASTITFTTAPASGLSFFGIILGAGINTATVADDTIGPSKLINTAVTAGSYTTADITVDAQGRITAAASGTIAQAEIANDAVGADQLASNAVVNDSVASNAAIAGTKISPDFGSQNIVTTGNISGAAGTFTGDVTIPDTIVHTGDSDTKMRFPAANVISFETAGEDRLAIGTGEVVVNDPGNSIDFRVEGDTDANLLFVDASTDRIGIGTNGPQALVDVVDTNANFLIRPTDGNAGEARLFLGGGGADQLKCAIIFDPANGFCRGSLKFCLENTADVSNVDSSDVKLTLDPTGNLTIADGDLVIGTAGHGIDFSATSDGSGTTSSEILDEYEEGSFDVNYKTGAAGSNTLSAAQYATTGGLYTKIGNTVHFQIRLKCSSHSTVGGQIVIEGLPFTHINSNVASGAYICASQMLGSSNNARLIISSGGTQIEFQNLDGTALQSGAGGLNFNNEFHCAGSYIAA